MRKYLLSFLAIFSFVGATFGQTQNPCIRSFVVLKNGVGSADCGAAPSRCGNMTTRSGAIEVTLTQPLAPGATLPVINSVTDKDGNVIEYCFAIGTKSASSGTKLIYCFYASANRDNLFNGNSSTYTFNITYGGGPTQTCTTPPPGEEGPLPVTLTHFEAKRNKEKVALAWETATEINNSGFDIQRKTGNEEWKSIAFVFSQTNNGNSNNVLKYTYTDNNTAKGISQYRLRQVDTDKRSSLSEVRSVRGEEQATQTRMFPNPSFDGKVNLVFNEQNRTRTISISDMAGRVVKQYRNVTTNSLQVDLLQDGIYTVHITDHASVETTVEKLIIKKR